MKSLTIESFEKVFKKRKPGIMGTYNFYSVLVPLVEKDGELHILYEVRAESLKKQPGEVCFPGGKVEEGEKPKACAVRETAEELNIPEEAVSVIAELDYMHTYSNFTMYAFLGVIDYQTIQKMKVNEDEVKEVFLVPVSFFVENEPEIYNFDVKPQVDEGFPYERINSKEGYNWRMGKTIVPIYQYEGRTIWGLTARITYHLMEVMKDRK